MYYLFKWLAELSQDVLLIEHFPLEAVLIVLMDLLANICWKLMERHVLLHLLVLQ